MGNCIVHILVNEDEKLQQKGSYSLDIFILGSQGPMSFIKVKVKKRISSLYQIAENQGFQVRDKLV